MTLQNKYSVVIHPSEKVINEVKNMKELLAEKIGWYHSKNALAHITINEFEASINQINLITHHLDKITQYLKTREVLFNKFDTFPNGAFFLAPDENSKIFLKTTIQEIHKNFNYKTSIKSYEPHITIGRKLTPENITIAQRLFSIPNILFSCDRLALREFNTTRKQFDIVEEFIFKEKNKEGEQGILF